MFKYIDYKKVGLSDLDINRFLYKLEEEGCHTHSILMAKGDNIFFEKYYDPFNESFLHRMYSETKSLVGIAVLFMYQDKLIDIFDKLSSYFPEYIDDNTDGFLINQTIFDSLKMETSVKCEDWFKSDENDRVKLYFKQKAIRPSGLVWEYDSAVSQVLEALVEKITGFNSLEYLKLKIFNDMGTFKDAYMLKTPDNRYWGDSGLMSTLKDMASFGRFLLNKGSFNNKQYLDKELIELSTLKRTCNNEIGYINYRSIGYGYQFFMTKYNGFMMTGLGNQLTICFPNYDLLFAFNSNDQGIKEHRETLLNLVYDIINIINNDSFENVDNAQDFINYNEPYTLINKINNVLYKTDSDFIFNSFKLAFMDGFNEMTFNYEGVNRKIKFGLNKYIEDILPIEGYSDMIGKAITSNHFYKIESKANVTSDHKIIIDVEIIDKYNGTLFFIISFKDNYAWVKVVKYAENFLNDFKGEALFIKNNA